VEGSAKSITESSVRLAFGVISLAEALDVSPQFIRLEWTRGNLKGTRLGRRVVFTRQAVLEYLASRQAE